MRLFIFLLVSAISVICEAKYEDNVYRYEGPPAPLAEDGRVIDTPEVAQARALHLAAHAEALRRLAQSPTPPDGLYQEASYVPPIVSRNDQGPLSSFAYDGRVTDSKEAARAKGVQLAPYNQVATNIISYGYRPQVNYETRRNFAYSSPIHVGYSQNAPVGYIGPMAPLGPDGRVIDTPEVAEAKAAHLRAHAYAASLVGPSPSYNSIY